MGQMRFVAPQRERVLQDALERAYLAGMEGIPSQSRNYWQDDVLVIERPITESASLTMLWPVDGYGEVALSTASLIERPRPYLLPLELARGTLNRLRNRAAEWQSAGYEMPKMFAERLKKAMRHFIESATSQQHPDAAAEAAQQSLSQTLPAMDCLAAHVSRQALALRHQRETRLNTLLGGRLTRPMTGEAQAAAFSAAFNTTAVPTCWRTIEAIEGQLQWQEVDRQLQWCREKGLRICAGPLLQLDQANLPDWLYLWDDDFANLHDCLCRFVELAVDRYRGQVHAWHAMARLNDQSALPLSEEQKLRLAVSAIETIRRRDCHTPLIMSFDQPWAEYMAEDDAQLSPLHFADALVRADLGIAGLGIELNLGYAESSLSRDVLQVESRIDQWSTLGLPLLIMLTAPSASQPDPLARRQVRGKTAAAPAGHSPETQTAYCQRIVELLLTKPAVQAVIWNQSHDSSPHEFAHGGLFDTDDRAKPILATLARLRSQHLV
jgi:hypothetical protein